MAHGTPHPLRPLRAVADDAVRTVVAAGARTRRTLRATLERAGLDVVAEGETARELVAEAVRAGAEACVLEAATPADGDWAIRTISTALPDAIMVLVAPEATEHEIAGALTAGTTAVVTTPAAAGHAVTLALQGHAVVPIKTLAGLTRRARWAKPSAPPEDTGDLTAREREVLAALRDGATTAEIAAGLGLSAVTVRRHVSGLRRKAGGSLLQVQTTPDRATLTARELQVLRLAAAGRGNEAIADELFITTSTVKNHLTRIMGKLGARNRTEAAVLAARQGDL